jgi:MoaA/NifB/PqqE/SkfB family radical SAM enzyme
MACSYCFRKEHDSVFPSLVALKEDAKAFRKYLDGLAPCEERITLSGGEPTLVGGLSEIFDVLTGENTKVLHLNSNMSAEPSVYNQLSDYARSKGLDFTVTASYHEEFMSLSDYSKTVKALNCDYRPQIVVTESNGDTVQDFIRLFPNAILSKCRSADEPPSSVKNPDGFYVKMYGKEAHRRGAEKAA